MRLQSKQELKDCWMQMTSMIDVVFLLLIFFMCVTEMNQLEAESLTLPIAYKAREDTDPPRERVTINIVRVGTERVGEWEFHINRVNYNLQALGALIHDKAVRMTIADGTSTLPVKIRADADCPYKYVQKVMFICSENRAWQISFGVQPNEIDRSPAPTP